MGTGDGNGEVGHMEGMGIDLAKKACKERNSLPLSSDGGAAPASPPAVPGHRCEASAWYSAVRASRYGEDPHRQGRG